MTTDPIADFLTRIRNASAAGLKMVEIPSSNTKRAMTQILLIKVTFLTISLRMTTNRVSLKLH